MLASIAPLYVRLSWTDPGTGHELELLAPLPVTLGRAAGNTILLNSQGVSRQHAQIERAAGGDIVITDRNSSNGTFLDGQRITRAALREGSSFQIGPFVICVAFWMPTQQEQAAIQLGLAPNLGAAVPPPVNENEATMIFQHDGNTLAPGAPPSASTAEVFPPASFQQPFVSVQQLSNSGLPITETTYLAIGGGMGSFAWVDHLRVAGVPLEKIISLSPELKPHSRYSRLCQNSQIPLHERIRSHSESCPDNLWGFPS